MVAKAKKINIVGLGEVVFDILPDCRKLGGASAEFLHYAIKHGAVGHLVSAIGADDLGREVITELEKFKINPVLSVTPYPTGRVLVVNTSNSQKCAHILENSAWDYIPFTETAEKCLKQANVIYFGTLGFRSAYSRTTLFDLLENAPKNAYKFFDVNFRQNYYNKELVKKLLGLSDILKLNLEELKIIKSFFNLKGEIDDICLQLKEQYNLKYLILTNSTRENTIYGDEITRLKNNNIQQTFAYGAGNAFSGAFIASVLQGMSQQDAHEKANASAIEICQTIEDIGQSFKCGDR